MTGCTHHLYLGDQAELVLDLQKDGVEGQLVGLLVEAGEGGAGLGEEAGVTRALLLKHRESRAQPHWSPMLKCHAKDSGHLHRPRECRKYPL